MSKSRDVGYPSSSPTAAGSPGTRTDQDARTLVQRCGDVGPLNLALSPIAYKPRSRKDAARNNVLLVDIARRLIETVGAEHVTMDAIAAKAGVGKGTVYRRFGNRAGLFKTLLDEEENAMRRAFLVGPPPLGPGAPPLQRLLAYGRARLEFVQRNLPLLLSASLASGAGDTATAGLERTHVIGQLVDLNVTGNRAVQADALIGLLDARYVARQLGDGQSLSAIARAWTDLACKLCAA